MREEARVISLAEWAERTNAETRRFMRHAAARRWAQDYLARADEYLADLMTDEQAAACAAADVARVRELHAHWPSQGAAWSMVDALVFALRRGLDAIKHPDNQRRLRELNDEQICEVAVRVQAFMPQVAPAWPSDDVAALISIWSKLRC